MTLEFSCSTHFRADGDDEAVAALDGSVAAPLVDCSFWTCFHMGLVLYLFIV